MPSRRISNWSATHHVQTNRIYEPQNLKQLQDIVQFCNARKRRLRCVGTGSSPNGVAFNNGHAQLTMRHCARILHVDRTRRRVTVEAGITVGALAAQLAQHGLTLPNYASLVMQQLGGMLQAGCHGSGLQLAPIDDCVLEFTLVTPSAGTVVLRRDAESAMERHQFRAAAVALGACGVVYSYTLQCLEAHYLIEKTRIVRRDQVAQQHATLLRQHRHVKYLWMPYDERVALVTLDKCDAKEAKQQLANSRQNERQWRAALDVIHKELFGQVSDLSQSCATVRCLLLAQDPTNLDLVKRVNRAEMSYRENSSQLIRIDSNDQLLQFDCGSDQWVSEVAFPFSPMNDESSVDLRYMNQLLQLVESRQFPAHGPFEQRFTSGSESSMSIASTDRLKSSHHTAYCWVGVIMYLPTIDYVPKRALLERKRKAVDQAFAQMAKEIDSVLHDSFDALHHWAKLELFMNDLSHCFRLRNRIHRLLPVDEFESVRRSFDANNILQNKLLQFYLSSTPFTKELLADFMAHAPKAKL